MPPDRLSWQAVRKTSAFRLTLLLGTAAMVGVLALLVLIYNLTAQELNQRSDHVLHVEAMRLSTVRTADVPAQIALSIRNSASGLNYFGLMSTDGMLLAGNLKLPSIPRLDRPIEVSSAPGIDQPLRIVARRAPSGAIILIGRDIRPLVDFRTHMLHILLFSALLVIPVLLLTSFALSVGPLRRVNRLQHVARTIAGGALDARMPIKGKGDELDLFAATVNQMVEAVERTVRQVKSVTDAIAHDLRTPLTHVRNQLYRTSRQPELDPVHAARIEQTIDELDFVIDRFAALMRISELEAAKRTTAFCIIALDGLARSIADLYGPLAEDRGIALALDIDEGARLYGDDKLIFEAMSNLLDNAIKFTTAGGHVQLRISTSGSATFIEVRDDGPGVPEEQRQTILRRFDRGSASAQIPGSGLGLSIVSAIVQLHHFSLEMEDAAPGLIARIIAPGIETTSNK
ncbi:MAG TPA: HAMP domain-containing sensor histidine kinase [Sphingobium sp.]|uniref:sensor histidine kinase n=1 Tax=Sphingobium sp. TaxID=1912891 RepID=UPI002ED4A006